MGLVLRKGIYQKKINYQLSDIGYIANFSTWHVFLLCGESIDKMLDSLAVEKQDDSRIIHKIKNLIEKDYAKDISLNYVAENVNLTPAYVSYIFKKETGQTLVKYITDVKMMKAKVMLEEGTLKIVQIAKACGYENQSYFNKLFKNYYGITPKQLREKI